MHQHFVYINSKIHFSLKIIVLHHGKNSVPDIDFRLRVVIKLNNENEFYCSKAKSFAQFFPLIAKKVNFSQVVCILCDKYDRHDT